jgi:hypothetical protein
MIAKGYSMADSIRTVRVPVEHSDFFPVRKLLC